jgi:hypothetical protein
MGTGSRLAGELLAGEVGLLRPRWREASPLFLKASFMVWWSRVRE